MNSCKLTFLENPWWKNLAKAAVFTLLLIALLLAASRMVTVNTESYEHHMISAVFDEPAGSLDGIYIGSSNSFAYWNSMAAFQEHGIAVMTLGSDSQPIHAVEDLIRLARRRQPDAVYIVNINSTYRMEYTDLGMHNVLDYLPFSREKLELTAKLMEHENIGWRESLEYYFPLIRFHSRWDLLTAGYFTDLCVDYKNSFDSNSYSGRIEDFGDSYLTDSGIGPVREDIRQCFQSLLDYCDEENVNILFVTVPQAKDQETIRMFNGINSYIASRGYPVLDLLNNIGETGIDPRVDFYNARHTNVHGSLKFTDYVSRYLIEHYGFSDKRSDPAYDSWRAALENYTPWLTRFALDFEIRQDGRDYSLEQPGNLAASSEDGGIVLTWEAVSGADGYAVYRKADGPWEQIHQTEGCTFADSSGEAGVDYTYTAVPYRASGDGLRYGSFAYNGVTATVEKEG